MHYSRSIGANLAKSFLIPVGLGKAMSNSVSSPVPFTLTTVPVPHLPCFTFSPTFQSIPAPPPWPGSLVPACIAGRANGEAAVPPVRGAKPPLAAPDSAEPNGRAIAFRWPKAPPPRAKPLSSAAGPPSNSSAGISCRNRDGAFTVVRPNKVRIRAQVTKSFSSAR